MTTREVSSLVGATIRQLQFWDERGVVVPAINDLGNREYTPRIVRDALIAANLRRKGITRLDRVGRILSRIGTRYGILVVPARGGGLSIEPDHRSAALAAERVHGPVIIINIQPIQESEVAQ